MLLCSSYIISVYYYMNTSNYCFRKTLLLFAFLTLTIFVVFPSFALAQQSGIRISPALFEETVDPGNVIEYSITLENLDRSEQLFYVFARNISGVEEGGVPIFANNDERTGFEVADWIDLPVTEVTVGGQEKTQLKFTMSVPDNASPGSHFGGIFFSKEPPEIENSGAAVGYQVANILSMRVSGEVDEQASIRQFSTSKFLYSSPNVDFNVRIENNGNVLVRPSGPLEIYNMLGTKIETITFNEERHGVFPKDTREFSNIKWNGDVTGFGRYEAILSPVYGDEGAKKTMSSTVTFWILPMHIIGPALGVLAFILIVTFVAVRLYIKRSLAHMQYGRRIVQRRRKNNSSTFLLFAVVMLTVTALFLIVLLVLFA